ncbi:MAG TPA: hypothetical protein VJX73_16230 [Terracidiphilus sp.]|nr:hypothetical protein [Terracidiphilus sp.]
MDTPTLVSYDIENGKDVINALDNDGKTPNVALWAKLPDYEGWRLVIASDRLDHSRSLSGYDEINAAMRKAGISYRKRPAIYWRPMDKPFIQALRQAFASAKDTYGMRLGGQKFGDQYLEDAFVYRIR